MDQQNISTLAGVVNATEDFLKSQIVIKDQRITELQDYVQKLSTRESQNRSTLQGLRDAMHEWTLTELGDNGITESQAEEIAEICDFELTKEFEVEVSVTYSVTVNARTAEDAENAIGDIDFDSVSYNDDAISYLSSNIDSIDI